MKIDLESRIYLACPYSHPSEKQRDWRYAQVTGYAGRLISEGYICFSPITHSHPIVTYYPLPKSWDFWKRFDQSMLLEWADTMILLALPGWQDSTGVKHETAMCLDHNIPMYLWERDMPLTELFTRQWDGKFNGKAL